MTQTMLPPVQTGTSLAIQPPAQQPTYVITDKDRARQKDIQEAWAAYDGDLPKPLKPMEGEADDNILDNCCAPVVNTIDDFLFGKELEISVEEGSPQEAQTLLDKTWGRKETRLPLLQDVGMNGSIAGRAFLRIVPSKDKPGRQKTFRLIAPDPSIIFVKTAPQDCDTVLLYCIEYSTTEQIEGKPREVFYREEIARIDPDGNALRDMPDDDDTWSIQHWTRIGNHGPWTPAGEPIIWPYPFAPLFSCKNLPRPNEFWATPDVTKDLIGLNNALNLVMSCINRTGKLLGNPILYGVGMGEGKIDRAPGVIANLPLPESKIVAVTLTTDIANMLKVVADLRSSMDERTSVPGVATGRIATMPRGNLSGIAIELLFMSLLKLVDKKRCLFGDLIINVSKALLVLAGMSGDIDMEISWSSPLPKDDLPGIQASIAKLEIGISKSTVQRENGYNPEEEAALNDTEDARNLEKLQAQQAVMPPIALPSALPGTPPLPGQTPPAPTTGGKP
jgi:hypothetical protein